MGSLETINYSPQDRCGPRGGVGEPKGVDFELQGHEKSRPAQLTPNDPEFEGRTQSYKAHTGRPNTGPDPG